MATDAEFFVEMIGCDQDEFPPELAKTLLKLRISEQSSLRIRELLLSNNAGTISPSEREDLDRYVRVGKFIDVLRAMARLSLMERT